MASLLTHFLNAMFRLMPICDDVTEERRKNAARRQGKPPAGVSLTENYLGLPCEFIEKRGNGDVVVLNIHGGGFTTGSAREARALSFFVADKLGCNVIACDYRLAPENKLPAAFDDCFEIYKGVAAAHRKLIIIGGSAGGTLAISTAQRAVSEGVLPPLAVAAFSPLAGIGLSLPSHKNNLKTDYMLKRDPSGEQLLGVLIPEGAGEDFLKDPVISPVYGTFQGFPPLFLSASDSEILYDDSVLLYEKATSCGVKCEFEIGHKMLHAWAGIPQIPEARRTLKNMAQFFCEV